MNTGIRLLLDEALIAVAGAQADGEADVAHHGAA